MIITRTPLRISFVGGGTDLPFYYKQRMGSVICVTPNLFVDVILRERRTPDIGLNEKAYATVDDIPNPVIREALRYMNIDGGLYLLTCSDVPVRGVGLGTSSAVLIGILNALYRHFYMMKKSASELAKIACQIEMDILQLPSGKQDAYACAHGGIQHLNFHQDFVSTNPTDYMYGARCEQHLSFLEDRLMLFFTGQQRQSTEVLRDVSDAGRIKVLQEIRMLVPEFVRAVVAESDEVGEILHKNWMLKQHLADSVSNAGLDDIYNQALRAGAIGGKLLGAGAGGFFLFFVPPAYQGSVRGALSHLQEFPVEFTKKGTHVLYAESKV